MGTLGQRLESVFNPPCEIVIDDRSISSSHREAVRRPRSPPGRSGPVAVRRFAEHRADHQGEALRREVLDFDEFPDAVMKRPRGVRPAGRTRWGAGPGEPLARGPRASVQPGMGEVGRRPARATRSAGQPGSDDRVRRDRAEVVPCPRSCSTEDPTWTSGNVSHRPEDRPVDGPRPLTVVTGEDR